MNDAGFIPLRTRETPQQSRAVKRVELILKTASEMLQTADVASLSTTAIAEKADIPVSSIYRYFPTVEALLYELYLQSAAQLRGQLFEIMDLTEGRKTWRGRLFGVLDLQQAFIIRNPDYQKLLRHFANARGLVAVDEDEHPELVDFLIARWQAGHDGFAGGDPVVVAKTTVQIALAMEDIIAAHARETPDLAGAYSHELRRALEAYLSKYLSDPA